MNNLERQLLKHEGLRLKPYRDSVGKLTIGIGRNLDDNGIREEEAIIMLKNDIAQCVKELTLTYSWFKNLDVIRQDAIINMCFNLGLSRLGQFKKMIRAIEDGDFGIAGGEALDSKWAQQVGSRALDIHEMIVYGRYPA